MNTEEEKLIQEFNAAFERMAAKVSREDVLCFLEATNYHALNKLKVRVLPDFIWEECVVLTEPMPEISDSFAKSDPLSEKINLNTLLGETSSLRGLTVAA